MLGKLLAMLMVMIITGVFLAFRPKVKKVCVNVEAPPTGTGRIKIAQLSDLHLDNARSVSWWNDIVDTVNDLKPDLIVLTGDIIEQKAFRLNKFVPGLKRLKAPLGAYAILGNHEFYIGQDEIAGFLQETDIKLLRNEGVTIPDKLHLIGIDDPTGHSSFGLERADLTALMNTLRSDAEFTGSDVYYVENEDEAGRFPVVLLSHQPNSLMLAKSLGVDLQLSGHTHGGQIWPFNYLTVLAFTYQLGHHQFDGFNLSDIFEYMSYAEYLCQLYRIIKASRRGGRLVYWNMLSDRVPPAEFSDRVEPLQKLARQLFMLDKAFFYKTFRIERIQ